MHRAVYRQRCRLAASIRRAAAVSNHRRVGGEPEAGKRLVRVALVRRGELRRAALAARHPAAQDLRVAPGIDLVGCHHQQLAEATCVSAGRQTTVLSQLGPQRARGGEHLAQQLVGEASAQCSEQRRAGRLGWPVREQPMRADRGPGLVQPTRVAIDGAESAAARTSRWRRTCKVVTLARSLGKD